MDDYLLRNIIQIIKMAFDLSLALQKLKQLITQTPFPQILLFTLAKVCTALMQMPHQKKQLTYIPFLICNLILLGLAIGLKILRHKFTILRSLVKIQMECFLLWIIGGIMMVFSWSLLDALEWGIVEIIMTMMCELLSLFMLTLLTKEQFITRMEFIAYELILAVEILAVSIKTVGFIKHNTESPHKDIVLLNLTTQIALMIILMDFIEKSYRRMKNLEVKDDMARLENQMVFTGKGMEEGKGEGRGVRETFQIKE